MLFRHRPAVLGAVALACGIYGETFHVLSCAGWVIVAFAAVSIALFRHALLRLTSIAIACIALGAALAASVRLEHEQTPLAQVAEFEKAIAITGTVGDTRETETSYLTTLRASCVALQSGKSVAVQEDVLVKISKAGLIHSGKPLPPNGSTITAYGKLTPFRPPTNPHEYASTLALQRRTGTSCMLTVRSGFDLYPKSSQTSLWTITTEIASQIHRWIALELDASIHNEESRGFVKAVVLGDRAEMERETVDNFTTAGVAHILAVSGFNVAIIMLVFTQLLRLLGLRYLRARTVVTIFAVIGYAFIVGWQPSVARAVMMIVLYLAAILFERKPDSLNIIASAAAIELLIRPLDLFDVGFQLSYSAVLGLVLVAPQIKRLLGRNEVPGENRKYLDHFIDVVALSVGASIASYPILVSHFYRISIVGFAANLPIVPLSTLITALGFLLVPLNVVSPWLGHVYGDATTILTRVLFQITSFGAHLPHAASAASAPSILTIILFVLFVIYVLRSITLGQCVARILLSTCCYISMSMIGAPLTASVLAKNAAKLQVLFFDVGQGDCIYLHTPNGKSYFIDFGTADVYSATSRAERTAIPFLRAEGETSVTAGFISHMHRDHFGGAPALLEQASIGQIFSSGERSREHLATSLERKARKHGIVLRALTIGDTVHLDEEVTLYTLHPSRASLTGLHTRYGLHANAGSLAFKIVYGRTSFLFLGDIEAADEKQIVSRYGRFLASDLVKVAHHGSLTSSSRELTDVAHPQYALISVGKHNRFGHPSQVVLRRWQSSGSRILRTDRDGAELLVSDGTRVERAALN